MSDKSLKTKLTIIFLNGRWRVTSGPVSPDPGPDDEPARSTGEPGASPPGKSAGSAGSAGSLGFPPGGPGGGSRPVPDEFPGAGWRELPPSAQDWLTEEEWVAWLASMRDEDPGLVPGEEPDPEDPPPPARKRRSPRPGQGSRAPAGVPQRGIPPAASVLPARFAGRLHLTIPLITLLGLAGPARSPAWARRPGSRSKYIWPLPNWASADAGSSTSTFRTVAPARSVTGVRHVY
jgi:hypothetical protein